MEIGRGSDTRSWIWLEVAGGAARMAAVMGCCRDIPSRFSCSPSLWVSWVGVFGLAVGPGDMQAVHRLPLPVHSWASAIA